MRKAWLNRAPPVIWLSQRRGGTFNRNRKTAARKDHFSGFGKKKKKKVVSRTPPRWQLFVLLMSSEGISSAGFCRKRNWIPQTRRWSSHLHTVSAAPRDAASQWSLTVTWPRENNWHSHPSKPPHPPPTPLLGFTFIYHDLVSHLLISCSIIHKACKEDGSNSTQL